MWTVWDEGCRGGEQDNRAAAPRTEEAKGGLTPLCSGAGA